MSSIKKTEFIFLAFVMLALWHGPRAFAVEVSPQVSASPPCAVLDNYDGEVQVLDSSRTFLVDAAPHVGIPCGGWVSVKTGWASVRHRDGYFVQVGANSFAQFQESNTDGHDSGDQVVLYRGEIFAQSGDGSGELRVVTADARARVSQGSMIVLYNHGQNETQLIALENQASLENRFETSRRIAVHAGEASNLNLKLLRVVPSLPRTASIASLKPVFADLHLSDQERSYAIAATRKREEREMASSLEGSHGANRGLASEKSSDYSRNKADKEDAALHAYWVKKMVGGQSIGESILYPDQYYGRPQKVHVIVDDPAMKLNKSFQRKENEEKHRLIEELSQIRAD